MKPKTHNTMQTITLTQWNTAGTEQRQRWLDEKAILAAEDLPLLDALIWEQQQAQVKAHKHAPGPWQITHLKRGSRHIPCWRIGTGNFGKIAVVGEGCDPPELDAANHANARLVAAAPELLAALEDCVQSLSRLPDTDGAWRTTCIWQAKKAIEKAKGAK